MLNPRDWAINHVSVDLRHQRVNVIANNGWNLRSMLMSSGSNGRTPRGTFHVYSRSAATVSNTDRRVSMRWMTRFRGGIGFHGIPRRGGKPLYTPLGQYPVSAGCLRMADHDAEWIYRNIPTGTRVVVK